jgi:hypothetical protein
MKGKNNKIIFFSRAFGVANELSASQIVGYLA